MAKPEYDKDNIVQILREHGIKLRDSSMIGFPRAALEKIGYSNSDLKKWVREGLIKESKVADIQKRQGAVSFYYVDSVPRPGTYIHGKPRDNESMDPNSVQIPERKAG